MERPGSIRISLPAKRGPVATPSVAALERPRVLENATRRSIYEHLLKLPGDHFRSIARSLSLGVGTVHHHLRVLVGVGLVSSQEGNGRSHYYAEGDASQSERNRLTIDQVNGSDIRWKVLFALKESVAAGPTAIARRLGISRQLAAYHLRRLEASGYVRRHGRSLQVSVPLPETGAVLETGFD